MSAKGGRNGEKIPYLAYLAHARQREPRTFASRPHPLTHLVAPQALHNFCPFLPLYATPFLLQRKQSSGTLGFLLVVYPPWCVQNMLPSTKRLHRDPSMGVCLQRFLRSYSKVLCVQSMQLFSALCTM